MDVIGDLVARDRRSGRTALRVESSGREISYRDFCTTAYKAGNVLRYLGVRKGAVVAVAAAPDVHPVWAFVGAAQLGALTRFVDGGVDRESDRLAVADARVLLVPVDEETAVDLAPGTKLATYGDAPKSPSTLHWETELWSENPAVHPTDVEPGDAALEYGESRETVSHGRLLAAAAELASSERVGDESRVVLRGSLCEPGLVVGLLAALQAGGTAVVDPGPRSTGDVAVVGTSGRSEATPEPRVVDASGLL